MTRHDGPGVSERLRDYFGFRRTADLLLLPAGAGLLLLLFWCSCLPRPIELVAKWALMAFGAAFVARIVWQRGRDRRADVAGRSESP